jgi:UTP:GlnB (protein PII) uridylyltransferase
MKSKEKINFKIISNKINSNQKKGQLWKSRRREKRKKKSVGVNPEIRWPHMMSRDGGVIEKI